MQPGHLVCLTISTLLGTTSGQSGVGSWNSMLQTAAVMTRFGVLHSRIGSTTVMEGSVYVEYILGTMCNIDAEGGRLLFFFPLVSAEVG